MKIIGHRGCAGLALENTLPGLELANLLGVDAVEFDVRKTGDGQLVLCHDATTGRVCNKNLKVSETPYVQLRKLILNDEESHIPLLQEALRVVRKTPVIIDLKETGCIDALLKILKDFPINQVSIASFKHEELTRLREHFPNMTLYALENTSVLDVIARTKTLKISGIGLNFWLLSPLTYFLLKRANLKPYVYTVNNRFLVWFIHLLYPQVMICTNHPELFIKHPWLKISQAKKKGYRATV